MGTSTGWNCGKQQRHYPRNYSKDQADSTKTPSEIYCNEHYLKNDSRGKKGSNGAVEQKLCYLHKITSHHDVDSYDQTAPRPLQNGGDHITAAVLDASSPPATDDEKRYSTSMTTSTRDSRTLN